MGRIIGLTGLALLFDVIFNFFLASTGNTFVSSTISKLTGISFEIIIMIQAICIVLFLAHSVKKFTTS